MSALAISTLILNLASIEASTTAKAFFHTANTGVEGYIGALNGFLWLELDFSAVDWSTLPTNCSRGGLKYHIHDLWSYGDSVQSLPSIDHKGPTECGKTHTGNHYDPWFACGPKSDSPDCINNNGCIPSSTIYNDINENLDNEYICNPVNYSEVAYTCEVGDLSGKYGLLMLDETYQTVSLLGNQTIGSYWEPSMETLYGVNSYKGPAGKSIVIHCNSGERAFCAPILRGTTSEQSIDLTDDQTIEQVLDDAAADFAGMSIKWTNAAGKPALDINIPTKANALCTSWELYLYNEWQYDDFDSGITASVNCDLSKLGGIFDPTHTCIANSSSEYCSNGVRCKDTSNTQVSYDCNADNEFFGCAVGDIYGRIGPITGSIIGLEDPLSPPLFTLGNKAIVFKCASGSSVGDFENVCALTVQTNGTVVFGTPSPTRDGVHINGVKVATFVTVFITVFMYCL
eukprot:69983_1